MSPDSASISLLLILPMLNLNHKYNYTLNAVGPSSESPNMVMFLGNVPLRSISFQQFLLLTSVNTVT